VLAEQGAQSTHQHWADFFDPGEAAAGPNRFFAEVNIDHGARPGPIRVEGRRGELQRSMGGLVGDGCWLDLRLVEADPLLLILVKAVLVLVSGWFLLRIGGFSCRIAWFVGGIGIGGIGGFGGSVPVVVLMHAEQLQGLGWLGEDPDGFGTAHLNRVGIALVGQDVGDPVDGGFEPDRITCGGAGDDQLQSMLAAAAEPDEPLLGGCGRLLLGTDRVGLDDGGFEQGLQPSPRHRS
jgi:hypothetical protein